MAVAIGTLLGYHETTALLGKGGMGEVYLARDTKLKREVAIKTLPEEFPRNADRIGRFEREADALINRIRKAQNQIEAVPRLCAFKIPEQSPTNYLLIMKIGSKLLRNCLI